MSLEMSLEKYVHYEVVPYINMHIEPVRAPCSVTCCEGCVMWCGVNLGSTYLCGCLPLVWLVKIQSLLLEVFHPLLGVVLGLSTCLTSSCNHHTHTRIKERQEKHTPVINQVLHFVARIHKGLSTNLGFDAFLQTVFYKSYDVRKPRFVNKPPL